MAHAWLPQGIATNVRLTVDDGVISEVRPRSARRVGDVRLPGVVLPGLANTHSHAFHRALRGRTNVGQGNFWTWRTQMYAVARALTPETYLDLAIATYAEMALAGYTAVGEFHYVHHTPDGTPYADPNAMGEALIEAARIVGIRLTLLDTCYLAGGLDGDGHAAPDSSQRRFTDRTVDAWATRMSARRPGPLLALGAAIHSVRAVPREAARVVADVAVGLPLHTHLSEQPAENLACQMYYGCSPTELLADIGAVSADFTAVHATHLSASDIATLGAADAVASFCPTTERDLADGIGPARELLDAGARLSIGSDQHVVIDPFEEMRAIELNERLATGERGRLDCADLLLAGSESGYASLGWHGGGRLEVGAPADFVAVRDDTVRTVGSKPGQLLFAASAADVDTVVVAGRPIVEDGHHHLGGVSVRLRRALDAVRAER